MAGKDDTAPKEREKLLLAWQKAAELGDAEAQMRLAASHADGKGVPKDAQRAFEWYLKAAEQGIAQAQSKWG